MAAEDGGRDVYFEFTAIGRTVKVSAIDSATGLVESKEPGQYCYSRPGEMVKCPWHGWEFDIRTGKSWCDPSRVRVRQYPVAVKPGTELVEGPYVAESFPVRVENNYVVVEA